MNKKRLWIIAVMLIVATTIMPYRLAAIVPTLDIGELGPDINSFVNNQILNLSLGRYFEETRLLNQYVTGTTADGLDEEENVEPAEGDNPLNIKKVDCANPNNPNCRMIRNADDINTELPEAFEDKAESLVSPDDVQELEQVNLDLAQPDLPEIDVQALEQQKAEIEERIADVKNEIKKNKWKRWIRNINVAAGTLLTGKLSADFTGCLPRRIRGEYTIDLQNIFSGSTKLQCTEEGKIDVQQSYAFNFGSVAGCVAGDTDIDQDTTLGKILTFCENSEIFNFEEGYKPTVADYQNRLAAHVAEKARVNKVPSTPDQFKDAVQRARLFSLSEKSRDCWSQMDGDQRRVTLNAFSFSDQYDAALENEKLQNYAGISMTTDAAYNAMSSMMTEMLKVSSCDLALQGFVMINDSPITGADYEEFINATLKINPKFIERFPDIFLAAPQMLAEQKSFFSTHPQALKNLKAWAAKRPEGQRKIALMWGPHTDMHTMLAAVLPDHLSPQPKYARWYQPVAQLLAKVVPHE